MSIHNGVIILITALARGLWTRGFFSAFSFRVTPECWSQLTLTSWACLHPTARALQQIVPHVEASRTGYVVLHFVPPTPVATGRCIRLTSSAIVEIGAASLHPPVLLLSSQFCSSCPRLHLPFPQSFPCFLRLLCPLFLLLLSNFC